MVPRQQSPCRRSSRRKQEGAGAIGGVRRSPEGRGATFAGQTQGAWHEPIAARSARRLLRETDPPARAAAWSARLACTAPRTPQSASLQTNGGPVYAARRCERTKTPPEGGAAIIRPITVERLGGAALKVSRLPLVSVCPSSSVDRLKRVPAPRFSRGGGAQARTPAPSICFHMPLAWPGSHQRDPAPCTQC
jgi:hypothetical protein